MKIHLIFSSLVISLFTFSCDSPSNETDNFEKLGEAEIVLEKDASSWITYTGSIPCADCDGILMELRLENQLNKTEKEFELKETYLGTLDGNRNFVSRGTYEINYGVENNPTAIVITLIDENKKEAKSFVQEDDQSLKLLGKDGKRIDSELNYRLEKN
jgi:copper homeostasis protein (lipoprotein)